MSSWLAAFERKNAISETNIYNFIYFLAKTGNSDAQRLASEFLNLRGRRRKPGTKR